MRLSSVKTHKVVKGFTIAVLLFLLAPYLQAATLDELQARLNELQKQSQILSQKASTFKAQVGQANQQIAGIKGDIQSVTLDIDTLQAEIDRTQNDIELTNLQIQKLGLQIDSTIKDITSTKEKTGNVLKALYQAEQISSFELVFSGSNFADFWDQHEYFSNLQSSLTDLIRQTEALKADLENKLEEQQQKKIALNDLQQKKQFQQDTLSDKRDQQKVLLAQNEIQRNQYQRSLNQTEGERGKLIQQILNTEEEVKRLHTYELYFKSGKIPPPGTKIFAWPAQGRRLSQGYGATEFARSGVAGYTFHNGIDIDGEIGDPIYAAGPGKVIGRNTNPCPNTSRLRDFGCQGGWGNWIAIEHPNGLVTLYGHMVRPSTLIVGSTVEIGQTIGFIGSSGNVTGSHLHFSVYAEFFLVPKGYPGYNPQGTLNPLVYL